MVTSIVLRLTSALDPAVGVRTAAGYHAATRACVARAAIASRDFVRESIE